MADADVALTERSRSILPPDLRAAYLAHGDHAHVFNALLGERQWRSASGAVVAYADVGRCWVAAGTPLTAPSDATQAAREFSTAAMAAQRRCVWFAVEEPGRIADATGLVVGAMPEWSPDGWAQVVATRRGIRAQLRRARAKGVHVRPLRLAEMSAEDRARIERLEDAWAATRRMEPMAFVVAHRQDIGPLIRRAWIAERAGVAVAYVTATPIPARRGWLIEDVRQHAAPNGTAELLFDTIVRELAADGAEWITPGMVPLAGDAPAWLRLAKRLTRPLYDFAGLEFFRARLHPDRWRPVYLLHPRDMSSAHAIVAVLRAFAGGSLLRFGWRSLLRRPAGLAWLLAAGLLPWTLGIAAMAATDTTALLGFSRAELVGWTIFDGALITLLWLAARQRRLRHFALAAAAAAADAALSLHHALAIGLGESWPQRVLRGLSVAAPLVATALLATVSVRAWRQRSP